MRTNAGLRLGLIAAATALIAACGGSSGGIDLPLLTPDPQSPTISALNIAFDRSEVAVPAGRAFVLVFENRESLPHNVSIYGDVSFRDAKFEGNIFSGPATQPYPVPALAPGTYRFRCDIHPIMVGLIVAS